jgi:hypothetical protein
VDTRFEVDVDLEIISMWTLVDLSRLLDGPFYLWWEGYASHHFHPDLQQFISNSPPQFGDFGTQRTNFDVP